MGSDKSKDTQAYDWEQPQFTCTRIVEPYWISRYPITVAQYRCFVAARGYEQPHYWTDAGWAWRSDNQISEPERYGGAFELDNHPQVGISWYEAVAFCAWLAEQTQQTVRLPTEAEWERAARHTDGRIYPWDNGWDRTQCNNAELGLGVTTAVGIFPGGKSQCSALDLSGNVWEWCSTQWLENYAEYQHKVRDDLAGDAQRVVRGGSFGGDPDDVRCAVRGRLIPHGRGNDAGFRVVVPSPGPLASV